MTMVTGYRCRRLLKLAGSSLLLPFTSAEHGHGAAIFPLRAHPSRYTTEAKKKSDRLIPSREIPFQVKVSNRVQLTGFVAFPVRVLSSPDNTFWTGTAINVNDPFRKAFRIPIIFKDKLAYIAAHHLTVDSHIHVIGELSSEFSVVFDQSENPKNQILVQSLNFVESSSKKKSYPAPNRENTGEQLQKKAEIEDPYTGELSHGAIIKQT